MVKTPWGAWMTPPARTSRRPCHVLLVEDSPAEAMLMALAVWDTGLPVVLHLAKEGEQALDRDMNGILNGDERPKQQEQQ